MRPAAFFPPAGLLLLCLGGGCGVAACWGRRRSRRLLFLGGGACIVSGILTLIGIVLYVGSVSLAFDSISGPLRVETRYVYSFGAAFRLCIGAFVLSEFAGVFVIHLFLAELRHRQNQRNKARAFSYNMMNSVSTDLLSPSHIPTATTSVAQISLTENCLDKVKPEDTPFLSTYRRPPVPKSNHFAIANHITNSMRVKVIPYTKTSNTKIQVPEVFAHSLESPEQTEIGSNSNHDESVRWAAVKRRRMVDLTAESMNSILSVGRLRRGNARSASNIRTKEEIPDFISCHKSTRSSKQLLYYSCRQCEQMVKQQQQQQQQQQQRHQQHQEDTPTPNSRRSPNFHRMPTSESTSSTSSDSITPSVSVSYSSYSESEEKLSDKLYCDLSPRRLSRSQCLRQPGTEAHKRRFACSGSSKNHLPANLQRVEDSTASESERRSAEPLSTAICRCPDSCSGAETLASLSEALAYSPTSTLDTPMQRPKKRAKPYQQVTSI
uniref:Pfam-B_7491 and Claudin_2 and Pfam-B_38 and Pfam-B_19705 and Pfam-B_6278 and Pfam-B_2154 and Pfam-B_8109 and Pfam-B_19082 domain containing protein n=1 Tax=Echinococcus granulosus TaxID=6210 RepID=A0A068WFU4_ECHGR|nr:Pfam-B_7491 and Claudin_2 and Pfam-B_38 and Pfam-B_19705 and Pfam-B_6278 and Pfam-B_2154 and Pfam-B_8109 and Pfam-B_19082 domain containing protein [Echinococcus granulosus]